MFILFTMRICGLEFSSSVIDRVGQIITNIPGLSRRALSQQVCELFNWRSRSGKLHDGNCRKALNKLHQQGVLELPQADIYELFLEAAKDPHGPKLLVRAAKSRHAQSRAGASLAVYE